LEEAVSALGKAVRIEPENAEFQFNLGVLRMRSGEVRDGVKSLRRAVKLDPSWPDAHGFLGRALQKQGEDGGGAASAGRGRGRGGGAVAKAFRKAVKAEQAEWTQAGVPPGPQRDTTWRVELARLLTDEKKLDKEAAEAEQLLQSAVRDAPDAHFPRMLLAATLMKRQRLEEAAESFAVSATLEPGPTDRSTLTGYGDVLNWLGRKQEAAIVFDQMVSLGMIPSVQQRTLSAGHPHYNPSLPRQPFYTSSTNDNSAVAAIEPEHGGVDVRYSCIDVLQQVMETAADAIAKEYWNIVAPSGNSGGNGGLRLTPEEEGLQRNEQDWVGLTLFDLDAGKQTAVCEHSPLVCALLHSFDPAGVALPSATAETSDEATVAEAAAAAAELISSAGVASATADEIGLRFSQARYSVLQPEGYIRPHCGGVNNRLRLHLAVHAPSGEMDTDKPQGAGTAASLSVNGSLYEYRVGKATVFDDTFEVRHASTRGLSIE
jgi:tetratricopeptide (TPR) repeat protein